MPSNAKACDLGNGRFVDNCSEVSNILCKLSVVVFSGVFHLKKLIEIGAMETVEKRSPLRGRMIIAHRFIGGIRREYEDTVREADG